MDKDITGQRQSEHIKEQVHYGAFQEPIVPNARSTKNIAKIAIGVVPLIHKLPIELLSHIFAECVELNMEPWALTGICKSWRQIALATPSMWRYLKVYEETGLLERPQSMTWRVNGRGVISSGKWSICESVDDLQYFVGKSGTIDLNVHYSAFSLKNDQELLYFLFANIASHIGSLSIDIVTNNILFDHPPTTTFLSLKSLTVTASFPSSTKPLLKFLLSRSPQLELLDSNVPINALSNNKCWNSLRILRLRGYTMMYLDQWDQIISKLHQLEILDGCPTDWPNASTPKLTLNRIKSINLRCQPEFLTQIQLPALSEFSLDVPDSNQGQPDEFYLCGSKLSYPNLVTLRIRAPDVTWFSRLSAPRLHTLYWAPHFWSSDPCPPLPNVEFLALRDITYDAILGDNGMISEKVFTSIFECAPLVHKVTLALRMPEFPPNYWLMDILERLDNRDNILCPPLLCLTLDAGHHDVPAEGSSLRILIEHIVKWRNSINGLPHGFEVVWNRKPARGRFRMDKDRQKVVFVTEMATGNE